MGSNIEQIEALFDRALDFRSEDRAAFLAGACGRDSALLARVEALLRAHDASEGILPAIPRRPEGESSMAEKPGERIGHYKLLEQIGEGGCGVVYMAEQEEPVRRRVALKIIKLGMDTKRVAARFEAERQALALMDHPNIARVFDGGATQSGRPYFVMELVRGTRITDYCERNDLSTEQRLNLVIQTCRAIQHAHQKGVIHRDVKPSNVLVTVHDGVALPKVIDFGIAKATEGRLTDQTLFTSFEQFLGTPAYMSPEQAQLNGLDVDTRTDVYSLGVLLYELLTGNTPFDAKELLAAGLDQLRKTILEKEPPRPSTRLTTELAQAEGRPRGKPAYIPEIKAPQEPANLNTVAAGWLLRHKELIRVLRGDLDWIVMKCLEKDRTRRYQTVNGLATDLERFLKGEPVVARPPSTLYRCQKLARRNRVAMAAAAAVVLALVLGTIGSTWEAIRARRAERAQGQLASEANRARAGEAKQRREAERHLYDALLGEARAKELSGRPGQRFESLEAVARAATIRHSTELRDAAIAALALPDLREQKHWQFTSHWAAEGLCFDDLLKNYAYRTSSGISIRRVLDDAEWAMLPVKDVKDLANGLVLRRFDRQSRYLAASCVTTENGLRCRVWDLTRAGTLALDLPSACNPDFSPDGRTIAVVNRDRSVSIREVERGHEVQCFRTDGQIDMLRFNPDGQKLAGFGLGSSALRIWEVASGNLIATILPPKALSYFAWNHDGRTIATGCQNGQIFLWDADSGTLKLQIEGHDMRVTKLAFSHLGNVLASGSWDRTLRLWDGSSGKQLVVSRTPDAELQFSHDDRVLAYTIEGETARLLEVAQSASYRRLLGRMNPAKSWTVCFSPDGRLVVASTNEGIEFWDVLASKYLGCLQTAECRSALFQNDGALTLIGSTLNGLYQWPVHMELWPEGAGLRVGAPKVMAEGAFRYLALDPMGRRALVSTESCVDPVLVDLSDLTNACRLRGHPGAELVALDPSGRWAATGTWKGTGVKIYETATGEPVHDLAVKGSAIVVFSPDGQLLAAADMTELRLWQTGTWHPLAPSLAGDGVSELNPLAFSPDGHLLAVVYSTCVIQLLRVPTLELVATLRPPTLAALSSLSFSPDGNRLAAGEWNGPLHLWDLRLLRQELGRMNMDWDLPPIPSSSESLPVAPARLQLDVAPFSKSELAQTLPSRDGRTAQNLIDLTEYYNAPLTQRWYGPVDGPLDLAELNPGVQKLGGVEFDVRGLIQIGAEGPNLLAYPNHVHGIRIGLPCRRLQFLHAAVLASRARAGDELGSYIIHFVDGRQIEIPIVAGKDVADWCARANEQGAHCVVAWTGSNPMGQDDGHASRLFRTTWENPYPQVPIKDFDFVSDKPTPGQPFLVAVTAEP